MKIRVTIPFDPSKPTKVQVSGVDGPSCVALTEGVERALGQVQDRQETEEYQRQPDQMIVQGGGDQ